MALMFSNDFRCPVCRARVEPGPQCRRCKADLSLLVSLEDQRRRALGGGLFRLLRRKGCAGERRKRNGQGTGETQQGSLPSRAGQTGPRR